MKPPRPDRQQPRRRRPDETRSGNFFIAKKKQLPAAETALRLNKFIAQAGVCARRDADALISAGRIKVNGEVVKTLGVKVDPRKDKVEYNGKVLSKQDFVYIVYNKPRNVITTMDDEFGRSTVVDEISQAVSQRVFPVGRLDRDTTGLLLLTNDGDLAKKLTHPSHEVPKLYRVKLDRVVSPEDVQRLRDGIVLEDGPARADKIEFTDDGEGRVLGIELHIGRNRIVRRMFEHLGYKVVGLDRSMFAGLTKKKLPRGTWRLLDRQEVSFLKMR